MNATVDDLVFSKGREWRDPLATDARPISTEDFHAASIMSNRLIDLDHYARRLNTLKEAAKKAVDDFVRMLDNLDASLPLIYDVNTSIFLA